MRAFVMKGIGKVGFAEKPIPTPGPTDAIVKTTKALICTRSTARSGHATTSLWATRRSASFTKSAPP